MSNKLEVNRDRLFTNGYRKYLQSLSHGALVDFILTGSNLSFTPAQERSLLLDELNDEQARHARATAKINELVNENRQLRAQIESTQPVNTSDYAGGFEATAGHENGVPMFRVIDLETNAVLHEGVFSEEGDFAKELLSMIFGGVPACGCAQKRVYASVDEYMGDHPEAMSFTTMAVPGVSGLSAEQIAACEVLSEEFEPYTETLPFIGGVNMVLIALPDDATATAFTEAANSVGINPIKFASYVVNHTN